MDLSAPIFSAHHHAMLFAFISRAVSQAVGAERAEGIIRAGVRQYGLERGRRMALRATAGGRPTTMASFMALGEWRAAPGEMERKLFEPLPQARAQVYRCPWQSAWEGSGLLPFGRFYCLEIDEALVAGFNPALRLDVNGTLTNGAGRCEFIYHEIDSGVGDAPASSPDVKTVMPWEYHAGHLFTSMDRTVTAALGQAGQAAMQTALDDFAAAFGPEAAAVIAAYRGTDFSRLPD